MTSTAKAYQTTKRVLKVAWLMKFDLNASLIASRLAVSKRTIKRDRAWLKREGIYLVKEAA